MNKCDLGRQREDRILVAGKEILHEIDNQPWTSTQRLPNHLGVSQFASSKHRSGNLSKQRHSELSSAFLDTSYWNMHCKRWQDNFFDISKIHDQTQKTLRIKTSSRMSEKLDIFGWPMSKLPAKFEIFLPFPNKPIHLILL
jgi:hypothetical protein